MKENKSHTPSVPDGLSPLASRLWNETTDDLRVLGLLATANADSINDYVRAYSRAIESDMRVREEGAVVETECGPRRNRHSTIARDAWRDALKFARKLGLTPASRVRMGRVEDGPEGRLVG